MSTNFKHVFYLHLDEPPLQIRDVMPGGHNFPAGAQILRDVTFVPIAAPCGATALATDMDQEPLEPFLVQDGFRQTAPPAEDGPEEPSEDQPCPEPPPWPNPNLPGWRARMQERARQRYRHWTRHRPVSQRQVAEVFLTHEARMTHLFAPSSSYVRTYVPRAWCEEIADFQAWSPEIHVCANVLSISIFKGLRGPDTCKLFFHIFVIRRIV